MVDQAKATRATRALYPVHWACTLGPAYCPCTLTPAPWPLCTGPAPSPLLTSAFIQQKEDRNGWGSLVGVLASSSSTLTVFPNTARGRATTEGLVQGKRSQRLALEVSGQSQMESGPRPCHHSCPGCANLLAVITQSWWVRPLWSPERLPWLPEAPKNTDVSEKHTSVSRCQLHHHPETGRPQDYQSTLQRGN